MEKNRVEKTKRNEDEKGSESMVGPMKDVRWIKYQIEDIQAEFASRLVQAVPRKRRPPANAAAAWWYPGTFNGISFRIDLIENNGVRIHQSQHRMV